VSVPKPERAPEVDPTEAAFDNARPLDEPISPEEVAALETALGDEGPVLTSKELLERLRPCCTDRPRLGSLAFDPTGRLSQR
jgi:hypothetical protein